MQMQEPEQWQSFDKTGTTGQEYGAYRAEKEYYEQKQKIYPQDRPGIVLGILTLVFSFLGCGPAILGFFASAMLLSYVVGPYGYQSSYRLTVGILGLIGSIVALLLFVTIFVLSVISVARRGAHYRRPRIHRE